MTALSPPSTTRTRKENESPQRVSQSLFVQPLTVLTIARVAFRRAIRRSLFPRTPSFARANPRVERAIRTNESRTKSNPLNSYAIKSHLRVATRTVVNHLRRRRGADADGDRRAGEVRERVRGGAHRRLCVPREARTAGAARIRSRTQRRNWFDGLKMSQYEVGKLEQTKSNPNARHSTPSRIARDERRSPWVA